VPRTEALPSGAKELAWWNHRRAADSTACGDPRREGHSSPSETNCNESVMEVADHPWSRVGIDAFNELLVPPIA